MPEYTTKQPRGILGGDHKKRRLYEPGFALHRYLAFLHGFQQGALGLWGGPVDLPDNLIKSVIRRGRPKLMITHGDRNAGIHNGVCFRRRSRIR